MAYQQTTSPVLKAGKIQRWFEFVYHSDKKKVVVMGNQLLLHYLKESCALSDVKVENL